MIEEQFKFTKNVAQLILWAYEHGYSTTFGDCYRDPRCPYGADNSFHRKRLAVDLNLFKDDVYIVVSDEYLDLGRFWESLDPLNCWGGRFSDGNHFSYDECPNLKKSQGPL